MSKIKDAVYCWKKAISDTLQSARAIPFLLVSLLAYQLFQNFITIILANLSLGFLTGFINYLVTIVLIAHLASELSEIIFYKRLRLKDMAHFSQGLFYGVMNTFFVVYLFEWIIGMLTGSMFGIDLLIKLVFNILLSAVLETVYIGQRSSIDAVQSALTFSLDNWLQWTIPNIFFSIVLSFVQLNGSIFSWISSIKMMILFLLGLFASTIILVFKGHLYRLLSSSSERKRAFQNQFGDWR